MSRTTKTAPRPGRGASRNWRAVAGLWLMLGGLALPTAGGSARAADPADALGRIPVVRLLPLRTAEAKGPAAARPTAGALPTQAWISPSTQQQSLLRRRFEAEARVERALGPHGVSHKALARLAQRRAARAATALHALAAAEPETLHVLLIRIQFATDRSGSLTSVTEDGKFSCQPDSTVLFDPPPHNKAFFEAHLRGLAEYWGSMSQGQLVMQTRVLPEGDCDAYQLGDIADYGPGSGGFWTLDGLVKLVKDMILAADSGTQADGSANLADFDFDDPNTYIVFAHAGGSLQSNLVFEEGQPDYSPNDIPTFFVQLGDDDAVTLTSHDSDTGQPGRVTECSVVPESTTQDGLTGSIASALYHEFGHGLGLPDLYSTTEGLPAVGFWDLMDNGTNLPAAVSVSEQSDPVIVIGLLPPSISIWCKWFLGWTEPIHVGSRQRRILLRTTQAQQLAAGESKSAQLDVSPHEFFLLENRFIPAAAEPDWGLIQDPATGVVLYLGRVIQEEPRVTVNTHQYDFFMPWPGGLLLWRVRQDRMDARIASNTAQRATDDRSLDLIEADGIQDIGVFDFSTRGFLGSENDAFRAETVIPVDTVNVVYPATATLIDATTVPSTASTLGVPTGAALERISPATELMLCYAQVTGSPVNGGDGFPVVLPHGVNTTGAPVPLRGEPESVGFFQFDAGPAVLMAASVPDSAGAVALYAYGPDGRPRFGTTPQVATLSALLAGPPASARLVGGTPSDTTEALVLVLRDGTVHAFSAEAPQNGVLREIGPTFPASFDSISVSHGPLIVAAQAQTYIVGADTTSNHIYVLRGDGVPTGWSANFDLRPDKRLHSGPCAASLDGNLLADNLAYVAGGALQLTQISGQPLAGSGNLALPDTREGELGGAFWALAWPQPEGPDRVLVASQAGGVWITEHTPAGEWSVRTFTHRLADSLLGEPALGDLDGDGRLELVLLTARYCVVLNENGLDRTGFPQRIDGLHFLREDSAEEAVSTPLVADVNGDGIGEVVFTTQFGLLYALGHQGRPLPGYPAVACGPQATAPLIADFAPAVGAAAQRALFLYDALGDTLRQGRRTRAAHLAARELVAPVAAEVRSAEWLGRAGGLARSGRAGSQRTVRPGAAEIAQADYKARVVPNPAHGSTMGVRFYSGADQTAQVTVYDLEGETVLHTSGAAAANITSELDWRIGGLAPGAYICRLDYVGPMGPTSERLTFYVER